MNFITRAIIGLNFLIAFLGSSVVVGPHGDNVGFALACLASSIWVAVGAAWALKCATKRGWVGLLIALGTAPVGVALICMYVAGFMSSSSVS